MSTLPPAGAQSRSRCFPPDPGPSAKLVTSSRRRLSGGFLLTAWGAADKLSLIAAKRPALDPISAVPMSAGLVKRGSSSALPLRSPPARLPATVSQPEQ